jgi:glutathione S-transferase
MAVALVPIAEDGSAAVNTMDLTHMTGPHQGEAIVHGNSDKMLEIWGRTTSSNVQKVLWCCSELDLEYRRHDAGREFGVVNTAEYRKMNPNGLVPTIRDGNTVIWESNTIQRYLATRFGDGSLYPADLAKRAAVDQWLDWELGTLAPTIFPVFWGLIRTTEPERDHGAINEATKRLTAAFIILDRQMSCGPYLTGDSLTLADIAMGNSVHRWFAFKIERPDLPDLSRWYERVHSHRGFVDHVAKPVV